MDRADIERRLELVGRAERPELDILGPFPTNVRRVGLLSGSFDPMTVAHAALAGALRERGCDLVLLVLSARTLPKEEESAVPPSLLDPADRVASLLAYGRRRRWLRVALASHGLLVDQVEAAASAFPGAELTVGMGSDKLVQLFDPRWYQDRDAAVERLFALATLAVATRAGDEEVLERTLRAAGERGLVRLAVPPANAAVSSRDVRVRPSLAARSVPAEIRPFLAGP